MSDFKNNPQTAGFQFSNLTEEELKIISATEQNISKHHKSKQILVAYDQVDGI